jgi:hypothetical protein
MPADYHIDMELGIVFMRAWSRYTDDELLYLQQRVYADSDFDPTFRRLADLSQVEQLGVTIQGIRTMLSRSHWKVGARQAIVAPTDLAFGMARMASNLRQLGEGMENTVFRTKDEAMSWLDSDESDPNTI